MEMGDLPSINLLNAYDTFTFLNSPNGSFKRLYTEQLLFGENDFPLYEAIFKLSDQFRRLFNLSGKKENQYSDSERDLKLQIATAVLNRQTCFYKTLELFLRFWIESLAKSQSDLVSLLNLAIITLKYVCLSSSDLEAAIQTKSLLKTQVVALDSMSYKFARTLQLDSIKKNSIEPGHLVSLASIPCYQARFVITFVIKDFFNCKRERGFTQRTH